MFLCKGYYQSHFERGRSNISVLAINMAIIQNGCHLRKLFPAWAGGGGVDILPNLKHTCMYLD